MISVTIPGPPRPQGRGRAVRTDEEILIAYAEQGSCRGPGQVLGLSAQTVHKRLQTMGASKPVNVFTEEEVDRLKRDYLLYRVAGKLDLLAREMGRTKSFICTKARYLGLTSQTGEKRYLGRWKYMTEEVARGLFDRFKASKLGLGQWCKREGFDDLGFSRTMKNFWPDEYEHVIEAKVPKQTKYRLGRAFEYRTRDRLRSLGYFVLRSPASRSVLDLVAIKPGSVLFIQCKRSGALGVREWNELMEVSASCGAVPILSFTTGRGVDFRRLVGKKDGSKRAQPFVEFSP